MATNNIINVSLSGQSGTGAFAGNVSPLFTTPNIGVASGTSINFGVSALNYYAENIPTVPVVTFAVPGDLSVTYATQLGAYTRIGDKASIRVSLGFTPTYTTASGAIQINGVIPFAPIGTAYGIAANLSSGITYPAGTTTMLSRATLLTTTLLVRSNGTGVAEASLTTANFPSGVSHSIFLFLEYLI